MVEKGCELIAATSCTNSVRTFDAIANTLFTLLDPEALRREAISQLLTPLVRDVIRHDRMDRLLANWPLAGMVAIVDSGSLVADLQSIMRTTHVWRAHIVFGEAPAPRAVADAILGGATDYLAWPCSINDLTERMDTWAARSATIRKRVEHKKRAQRLLARLSKRESQVLKYVAEGMTSTEIGVLLGLSSKTVEIHRYNISKKVSAKRLASLIKLMIDADL